MGCAAGGDAGVFVDVSGARDEEGLAEGFEGPAGDLELATDTGSCGSADAVAGRTCNRSFTFFTPGVSLARL